MGKSQAGLTSTFPVRIDGWVTRLNSVAGVKEGKLARVTAARYSFPKSLSALICAR